MTSPTAAENDWVRSHLNRMALQAQRDIAGPRLHGWAVVSDYEFQRRAGVYVIFSGPAVVYVGSSVDMVARMSSYQVRRWGKRHCPSVPWAGLPDIKIKVKYTRKYGEWLMVELRLIERLKPKFNRKHKYTQCQNYLG